jgi:hypothetical protein
MAVTVEIPTRVRLDVDALQGEDAELLLADALRSAAARALRSSSDAVLAGGGLRPVLCEPELRWYGDGLPELDSARREAIEASVMGALAGAVAEADVRAPDTTEGRSARGEASEQADPDRRAPILRRYVIPSYDGGGRKVAASVVTFGDEEVGTLTAGGGDPREVLAAPNPEWTDDTWIDIFLLACHEAGQGVPADRVVGFAYADPEGGVGISFFHVTALTREGVQGTGGYLRLTDLWVWHVDDEGHMKQDPLVIQPRSRLELRGVHPTPTPELRLALKAQRMREQVSKGLADERVRLVAAVGEEGFQSLLAMELERIAGAVGEDPAVQGYVDLLIDGRPHLIALRSPLDLEAGKLVPLVPLTEWVPSELPGAGGEEGAGRGGGTGRGAGRRAGATAGEKGAPPGPGGGRAGGTGQAAEGGYVAVPGAEGAAGGALFPVVPSLWGETVECEPFLEEPALSALGADGERLRQIIARVAAKLAIEPCEYAGGFALMAATVFGARAADVGQFTVTASDAFVQPPAVDGAANLGSIDFQPAHSPAIEFMRHIAGVSPDLRQLVDETVEVYGKPEHRGKIGSFDNPISWTWRFRAEMNDEMGWSVAVLFGMTCRVLLLQLLRSSASQLQGRLDQIDAYAELFEQVLLPRVRRVQELIELRELLRTSAVLGEAGTALVAAIKPAWTEIAPPGDAGQARAAWTAARAQVTDSLKPADAPEAPVDQATAAPPKGTVTWTARGEARVHDGRGRAWSMSELESGIVMRRGWIESLDPLVKQLVELDEVLARFDNPVFGVRAQLELLLRGMLESNREQTAEVEDSWIYAFRASRISESIPQATVPYTSYPLHGIHLQAHNAVGDAFHGDGYYALGINALFASELGRLGLISFFEFTGTLLLAVACPPLGAAAGVALAGYHLEEAEEKQQLYQSLIDPELVITYAEVEQELFVARLGFALSVIPEAGTILRGGMQAGRLVARAGVRTGVQAATARLAWHLTEETLKSLRRGIVVAFLRELTQEVVMDQVAQRILGPIVAQMERETTITGPAGGEEGAESTLERLAAAAGVLNDGGGD